MSTLRDVTDATFDAEVLIVSGTVVVDFWAEWCGPCRYVEPVLEQLAAEHRGTLTVVKVNADENISTAAKYHAMSLPTLKVFRDGEVVKTIVGAKPKPAMEAELAPFLV
jgi:thioredoxin 1